MRRTSLFLKRSLILSMLLGFAVCLSPVQAQDKSQVPDWVVYPEKEWSKITPAQAGFDEVAFRRENGRPSAPRACRVTAKGLPLIV